MRKSLKQIEKQMSRKDLLKTNEVLFNTLCLMVKSSIGDVMTEYITNNPPNKNQYLESFKHYMDLHNSFYLEQIARCFETASNCNPKDSKDFSKIINQEIMTPYVKECLRLVKKTYADKLK